MRRAGEARHPRRRERERELLLREQALLQGVHRPQLLAKRLHLPLRREWNRRLSTHALRAGVKGSIFGKCELSRGGRDAHLEKRDSPLHWRQALVRLQPRILRGGRESAQRLLATRARSHSLGERTICALRN